MSKLNNRKRNPSRIPVKMWLPIVLLSVSMAKFCSCSEPSAEKRQLQHNDMNNFSAAASESDLGHILRTRGPKVTLEQIWVKCQLNLISNTFSAMLSFAVHIKSWPDFRRNGLKIIFQKIKPGKLFLEKVERQTK